MNSLYVSSHETQGFLYAMQTTTSPDTDNYLQTEVFEMDREFSQYLHKL